MGTVQQLDKTKTRARCRDWRLWVNEAGSRRSRRFHDTYTEARAALEAFEAEGRAPGAGSVLQLAESWREWRQDSGQFAPGTLENTATAPNLWRRA